MNKAHFHLLTLLLLQLSLLAAPPEKPDGSSLPIDPGWPREITHEGTKLVYYQPQIDEWKDYNKLTARVAFSLTPKGGKQTVGIATIQGDTVVDKSKRTVMIDDLHFTDARFPSLPEEDAQRMETYLKATFPGRNLTVSLDRLVASLDRSKESFQTVELKMDPPEIFTSTEPAVLLSIDGKPVPAPIEGTKLKFIVNTTWDLFHDQDSSNYFLLSDKTWLTAAAVEGPWSPTAKVPADLSKLPKEWDNVKKALPATLSKGTAVPRVIYTEKPAEMILFKGTPVYAKIEGTNLMWAKNTDSWVFRNEGDHQIYFLVTGRWFRAPKLEGPWTYAGNDLPEDFKKIPADSEAADLLASVPGTEEAEDAVLLAQVPTEAVIKREEAEGKVKVSYQGDPQFKPIEGTSLTYAVNTSSDIILCQGKYYLCQNAVWLVADAPAGPWKLATMIPAELYKIPPSSPMHHVTYVKVKDASNPNEVVYSYTSGYFGSFVAGAALGAWLVWGTGWYYEPWTWWGGGYPVYYPYYRTYGAGAVYNPWTGGYAVGSWGYGPYGGAGHAAWYNPNTGRYGRVATAQGAYGGRTVATGYNPRTNTGWATRQGHNAYAQWGTSAIQRGDNWVKTGHVINNQGAAFGWHGSEGGGRTLWHDGNRTTVARHDGSLYAGHDGNVYRHDQGGGWSKWDNGSWNQVGDQEKREQARDARNNRNDNLRERTSSDRAGRENRANERTNISGMERHEPARHAEASSDVMSRLNREATSRNRGAEHTFQHQNFQRSGSRGNFGSRSFGGGGRHFGGGFRRR